MRVPFHAGYVVCHCPLSYEVGVEAELLVTALLVTNVDGVGTWPVVA